MCFLSYAPGRTPTLLERDGRAEQHHPHKNIADTIRNPDIDTYELENLSLQFTQPTREKGVNMNEITINANPAIADFERQDIEHLHGRNIASDVLKIEAAGGHLPLHGGDCYSSGNRIGQDAHLRELIISSLRDGVSRRDMEEFFRGVATNRSIKKLRFEHCHLFDGELFTALIPFFKNNHNFECLEIDGCSFGKYELLASALSEFCNLKEFVFASRYYVKAGKIIPSLNAHSGLRKLVLRCVRSTSEESDAFQTLIRTIAPNLTVLDLGNSHINANACKVLFDLLPSLRSKIQVLNVGGKPFVNKLINDKTALPLAYTLVSKKSLRSLDLTGNHQLSVMGWSAIFATLRSQHSRLESLNLSWTRMNDDVLNLLTQALVKNKTLQEIDLSENNLISPSAWEAFFSDVLQNPTSSLNRLDLTGSSICDEAASSTLIKSLGSNTTLKHLILDMKAVDIIRPNISNLLCNTSSIMETYSSNHTLQSISDNENELPHDIKSLLQLNREHRKSQSARLKIVKAHFSTGFVTHPLLDSNWKVIPHAVAWIGHDGEIGSADGHFYEYIKNISPQICRHDACQRR